MSELLTADDRSIREAAPWIFRESGRMQWFNIFFLKGHIKYSKHQDLSPDSSSGTNSQIELSLAMLSALVPSVVIAVLALTPSVFAAPQRVGSFNDLVRSATVIPQSAPTAAAKTLSSCGQL
ncbi:hypothetical protein K488DRAFT_81434 [Vararia minispora EC-137]|uniref:Uncharacterized protein n=1 Tax=Vararia minispora EC-137 TaxID=1314806 RepID=A0ACB8QZ90_9AGAM|nr:hypothetical protein K488DRAFT_81434 [Vararia minispora EC-137]